jgi:hypothetical protein
VRDPSRDLHISATRSQGLDYTTKNDSRIKMEKMMKMRRRNCYADVITKAEEETDRPHYGSCITINHIIIDFFPLFFILLKRKMGLAIFRLIAVPFFSSHLMANCVHF